MTSTIHPCKYDPDHGLFRTPVLLAQHYATEHSDVYVPPAPNPYRYRCVLCGKVYRNPSSHVHQFHPDEPHPYIGRILIRVDEQSPATNGVDVMDQLRTIEDQRQQQRPPVHHGPWEVDDIVLPVMEQLALPKGLIPVVHLAAIFAWRDATAVMLSAVTGTKR